MSVSSFPKECKDSLEEFLNQKYEHAKPYKIIESPEGLKFIAPMNVSQIAFAFILGWSKGRDEWTDVGMKIDG